MLFVFRSAFQDAGRIFLPEEWDVICSQQSLADYPVSWALRLMSDAWSALIVHEIAAGLSRFDMLHRRLGIGPNILSRRLKRLMESGVLTKVPYQGRPLRYEYVLTQAGRDFVPILRAIEAWGQQHHAEAGSRMGGPARDSDDEPD